MGEVPHTGESGREEDPAVDPPASAFRGITTRGRSFLAAGAAAALCAYALGQTDLLHVGVLLAALPAVCVLVQHRAGHRVTASRVLVPDRVPPGTEVRVRLQVENTSRLPAGPLRMEDTVPHVLGPRPRFVLDRTEPGSRREVSYLVRSDLRGRHTLGPLQLRQGDPFGMCEVVRPLGPSVTLTVVPRTEPLPAGPLTGDAGGRGTGLPYTLALAGDDDVIPRGYRHGDDLRRVHWRSTARRGELMVRREEQPQTAQCTVLLDTRRASHPGSGPESPFEWAVSGAASVALHLLGRGCAVRLLTAGGTAVPGPGASGGDARERADQVLEVLASVEHSEDGDLAPVGEALSGAAGPLVAFLGGDPDEHTVTALTRLRPGRYAAVAFLSALPGAGPAPRAAGALREAGWAVLTGGPGRPMAGLWQQAGESVTKGAGR